MKNLGRFILLIFLVGCQARGQKFVSDSSAISEISIPFNLNQSTLKPLISLVDHNLENKLRTTLNADPKFKKLLDQKKMAIGLVLLNDTSNIKYARINGQVEMYAASLPKIAILLSTMDAISKGEIEETEAIRNDMRIMISRSNNQAATRLIDLLGYEKIESVLTDPKYRLYDEEFGGGLWVGKRYAKTGKRYPDPLHGISHAATVTQVCRFYYMLINGELVSYEKSKEMLQIMEDPEIHHKFVNSLETIAPQAKLFRKSGSWQNYHSDSILVWGPEHKYILVALTEDPDGERLLRQLVFKIENILKSMN
ncbi:MAG: serine hydrolase [Bacteroidales bacterium]|nr:serine hydrolase [Bacteroidales bacterium]